MIKDLGCPSERLQWVPLRFSARASRTDAPGRGWSLGDRISLGEGRSFLVTPPELIERAAQLLSEGKLADSLATYQKINDSDLGANGFYGIGYIRLRLGDSEAAASAFRRCLSLAPTHANAAYYLGIIAENEHQADIAEAYFRRALSANPNHAGASAKVVASTNTLGDQTADPRPPKELAVESVADPAGRVASLGLFHTLQQDPNPLAQQAVQLITALDMSVHPRLSAYVGGGWFAIIPALLISAWGFSMIVQNNFPPSGPSDEAFFIAIAFCFPVLLVAIIAAIVSARNTTITFEQGRVRISSGIFAKRVSNIELYRIMNFEVRQSFWNRITRDGSLILTVESGPRGNDTIKLRGLATRDRLDEIADKLRNLIFLLRSIPYMKGIIY